MKTVIALFALVFSSVISAQEINVEEALNEKLLTAGAVSYGGIKTERVKKCRVEWREGAGSARNGTGRHVKVCEWVNNNIDSRYHAPAKVKSTRVHEIENFAYHEDRLVELPRSIVMKEVPIYYCISGNFDNSIGESLSVTRGHSFRKDQSVRTTVGISANVTAGSASMTANYSREMMVGQSEDNSRSENVTKNMTNNVRFQGPQAVNIKIFAYETTVEIPYSGRVIVDAHLTDNNSGITMASQLLSVEERTFPISGALRVDEVSNVEYRVFNIPGGCDNPEFQNSEITIALEQYTTTPELAPELTLGESTGDLMDEPIQPDLVGVSELLPDASPVDQVTAVFLADPQVIGPANGVSYRVVSRRPERRADPSCGYTDLGFAKVRDYQIETREYQEARDGKIVRTWNQTVETARSCSPF